MKVAVIGSRNLSVENLKLYLTLDTTEIVSGGAKGVDRCAKQYASSHGIPLKEFLPDYKRYHKRAPLMRNLEIIDYADLILAFWDGKSHGTAFVISNCKRRNKECRVFIPK